MTARRAAILFVVLVIALPAVAVPIAAESAVDWSPRMSSILQPEPPPPPQPAPRIEVILRPTLITLGEAARLQWRAFNAERVFLNGVLIAPYGDIPVSPDRNTEYHFTADGPGGRTHEVATLTVQRPVVPPTARLIVQPERIAAGECADILWSSEYALTVLLDSQPVPVYGVRRICPEQSQVWQMTAEGPGGIITRRAFLQVDPAPPPPPPPPPLPEVVLIVHFDYNQSRITAEADRTLRLLAERLGRNDAPIQVVGHADGRGADSYNANLGMKRATAVRDRLAALGIAPDRMELRSRGETRPVAPNSDSDGSDNPNGRRLNRRVEIQTP